MTQPHDAEIDDLWAKYSKDDLWKQVSEWWESATRNTRGLGQWVEMNRRSDD